MKISKKHKAFSFIEVMVIVAIIAIMSAVGLASLQSAKSVSRLKTAQREVAATIKLAQSYALQGKMQNGVTPCGYGFRFTDATNYEIFYNTVGNYSDCEDRNGQANGRRWFNGAPNLSVSAETYALKNGVSLNSDINSTEMYFTVPHGNIYDRTGSPYPAAQTFQFSFLGSDKTITINPGGFVTEN